MIDFTELYRKYAPDVFRFALYLCGNSGDAEDITAETFVRVWAAPAPLEIANGTTPSPKALACLRRASRGRFVGGSETGGKKPKISSM